ncbi:hypothetical protein EVAR_97584_1 [Eumeta japonica]|uniref:Uncharacterized protein n=1 Tax=Eumeta variegata TaxID=151549 RepID=A0A4C1WRQ2_EUMVA|nr:hypothetical protein EVAR_97584_1 [Eumeta japonica]
MKPRQLKITRSDFELQVIRKSAILKHFLYLMLEVHDPSYDSDNCLTAPLPWPKLATFPSLGPLGQGEVVVWYDHVIFQRMRKFKVIPRTDCHLLTDGLKHGNEI